MNTRNAPNRIFVLLVASAGTAAVFLPMVRGNSPLNALMWGVQGDVFRDYAFLAAPFFLFIPIILWQARRLATDLLSTAEIVGAYLLSIAAMLSPAIFLVPRLLRDSMTLNYHESVGIAVWLVAVVANGVVLMRNWSGKVSRESTAEVFMLGAYLPNTVFCVAMFYRDLQIGAYLPIAVSAGHVASIAMLVRGERLGSIGPAGAA